MYLIKKPNYTQKYYLHVPVSKVIASFVESSSITKEDILIKKIFGNCFLFQNKQLTCCDGAKTGKPPSAVEQPYSAAAAPPSAG